MSRGMKKVSQKYLVTGAGLYNPPKMTHVTLVNTCRIQVLEEVFC